MNAIICLGVCLLVAVVSFYLSFSNKVLKIRVLFWVPFFSALAGTMVFWLKIFFPEISWGNTISSSNDWISFLGKTCLALWVALGFFMWVYLNNKQLEDKHMYLSFSRITKKVGKIITIVIAVLILIISFGTFLVR